MKQMKGTLGVKEREARATPIHSSSGWHRRFTTSSTDSWLSPTTWVGYLALLQTVACTGAIWATNDNVDFSARAQTQSAQGGTQESAFVQMSQAIPMRASGLRAVLRETPSGCLLSLPFCSFSASGKDSEYDYFSVTTWSTRNSCDTPLSNLVELHLRGR